ncbi:MAG: cytochrome c biogenesis protein CcsA [Myxococcales bacterium]
MTDLAAALQQLEAARGALASWHLPLTVLLAIASAALLMASVAPAFARLRRRAMLAAFLALTAGELALLWFHLAVWRLAAVVHPMTGEVVGHVAPSPWIESEKLYVWALMLAALGLVVRKGREEVLPILGVFVAALTAGALLQGRPFAEPLPRFFEQYSGYVKALYSGNPYAMMGAFRGIEGARQGYYNAWYMWVHPPLLFLSYGAFAVAFAALVRAIAKHSEELEAVAAGWARIGYLPLTAGILLGVPWALMSWTDQAWWWSGKVNMSLMMWLLYSAWLHARLYLKNRGMWTASAALGLAAFAALVLTYLATYFVPGAHSVA